MIILIIHSFILSFLCSFYKLHIYIIIKNSSCVKHKSCCFLIYLNFHFRIAAIIAITIVRKHATPIIPNKIQRGNKTIAQLQLITPVTLSMMNRISKIKRIPSMFQLIVIFSLFIYLLLPFCLKFYLNP